MAMGVTAAAAPAPAFGTGNDFGEMGGGDSMGLSLSLPVVVVGGGEVTWSMSWVERVW